MSSSPDIEYPLAGSLKTDGLFNVDLGVYLRQPRYFLPFMYLQPGVELQTRRLSRLHGEPRTL